MNKFGWLFMGFILLATGSKAQDKYWVFFQDKGLEAAQFSTGAEKLLSPRAIARRARHGFTFSPADYPVSATYLRQLQDAGVQIHATSKWMNAASIRTALDYRHLQQACPAIVDMRPVGRYICTSHPAATSISQITDTLPDSSSTSFTYGVSANQLDKMELPCLHERGYTGEGVLVAVFDAGFYNVDTISAFDSTWLNNRVVSYYDFVDNDSTIFNESTHGLGVISTIIANRPGVYVGAAPHVSVVMARTENVFSETHQEEDDWLRAMEWADSIGVDIIQSSLGYNYFDTGEGDYTYQDMNGDTAIITRAADLAAARGILVVTSAGNEGNGSWRYITAPCDADSVLCVGSINPNDTRSSFSSVGPTADGRIKPDVVAMGGAARIINTSGNPGTGSGTSFAAPQIAGLVACLIQAHPNRSNMDVIAAVKQSADQFLNPDSLLGHGVPNACIADSILSEMDSLALESATMENIQQYVRIFPNPAEDILVLEVNTSQPRLQKIDVLNAAGARVIGIPVTQKSIYEIGVQDLPAGMYILRMDFGDGRLHSEKFIRQ